MKLYRITEWSKHYETHETRKLAALRWVPLPNKHDGLTFRQIGQEKNAAELYAAWVLMVQLASKSDKDHRGQLFSNGRPLTVNNMALITGFPAKMFERALAYFTHPNVGWMDTEEFNLELPLLPGEPGDAAGKTGAPPEKIPLNGMEGNGKEENRRDAPPAPAGALAADAAFCSTWQKWVKVRTAGKKPKSGWNALFTEQLDFLGQWDARGATESVKASLRNGWQGIFPPKKANGDPWPTHTGSASEKPKDGPPSWREILRRLYPESTYSGEWNTLADSIRQQIERDHEQQKHAQPPHAGP